MTRLDASNEPSMEDILASIRKIIAEDPPGSRPTPIAAAPQPRTSGIQQASPTQPAATAAPSSFASMFSAAPQRDPLFDVPAPASSAVPAATTEQPSPVTPEPYLKAQPVRGAPQPEFKSEPKSFIPSASTFFPKDPAPVQARVEPSFAPLPELERATQAAAPGPVAPQSLSSSATVDAQAALLSVDAQLSDLLGDVMQAPLPATPPTAAATEPASAAPSVSGFPSRLMPSHTPASEHATKVEHRDGFTVSRVAFGELEAKAAPVAQAPVVQAPVLAAPTAVAEPDPFDFDLGPSPFETKPTAQPAAAASSVAAEADVEVEVVAPRAMPSISATLPPAAEPQFARAAEPQFARAAEPAVQDATPPPVAQPVETAPAASLNAFVSKPFIAPSVGVSQVQAAPTAVDAALAPQPIAPHAEPEMIVCDGPEAASAPAESSAPNAVAVISEPTEIASSAQRTMEDTVAELLRPMLRSWLAENMPRIVERALRREVAEQLASTHKTAAE